MKKSLKVSLFYGSLWGIAEATLGYILHWVFFPISGMIMFPIGAFFMKKAEKDNNKSISILTVSVVAAFIKLINIFIPNPSMLKVINPVVMILAQGLFVYVLLRKDSKINITKIFSTSILWRSLFLGILILEFKSLNAIYYFKASSMRWINFLVIESVINSVIIYVINKYALKTKAKFNPNFGFIALFLAIGIQLIL